MDYLLKITIQFLFEFFPKSAKYLSLNSAQFRWYYILAVIILIGSLMLNVMMSGKILAMGNRLISCRESKEVACTSDSECRKELDTLSRICIRNPGTR